MVLISDCIGSFGKYHFWLCVLIFPSKLLVALHQMAIIFLAPPAKYQCPDKNQTCCDNPVYDTSIFSRTIVTEWNLICEKSWLKDFTQTLFQLGVLIGSCLFGMSSDRFGRKQTIIAAVVLNVFSGIVTCFLPDFWSFTIIRLIVGFATGGILVVGFIIIMEYVGPEYREVVSALYHIPFTAGHMLLALIGYLIRDYMYFHLGIALANSILLIYICFVPESPRWLLAMNKRADAVTLMTKVAKINKLPTENIQDKIDTINVVDETGVKAKKGIWDLFRTPNLRRNIMVMSFNWFVCSYCFYGIAYYISHLTGDVFLNVLATGSMCCASCLIAIPLMKVMGRKSLVILANLLSSLSVLIIAVIPEGVASTVLGCVGILFSFLVFVVVYLYCSELFPTVVRNGALGIASMMARLGAMIAPFASALRPQGKWCAPVAFGLPPLVAAVLCVLLPETKNCELSTTIEEAEAIGGWRRVPREPAVT